MILSRRNVFILSIVAIVAVLVLVWSMRSGSAVDDYVAQLRAKGEPLFFSDLPPPKMTNGTPGLDKLVSAAGPLSALSGTEAMIIKKPGEAEVTWTQPRAAYSDWQQFHRILQTNELLLSKVRDSLEEPEPDMGWHTNIYTFRRTFIEQRIAAQALAAEAIGALHEKDYVKALKDIQALAHMSQLEREDTWLVSQMIRGAIANLGLSITWEALQADGWSEVQLVAMQRAWAEAELLSMIERGCIGARVSGYAHMRALRQGESNAVAAMNWSPVPSGATLKDRAVVRLWSVTVADHDNWYYLQTMQQFVEYARLATHGAPLYEVNQKFARHTAKVNVTLTSPMVLLKLPMASRSIANFARAAEACIHYEVQRNLTIAAIALTRYKLSHGRLPENLEALVPQFCSAVPLDAMDHKPLRYHPDADGTFVLYSIGDNGLDDHGYATPPRKQATNLFSGLDIVWPRAAKVGVHK